MAHNIIRIKFPPNLEPDKGYPEEKLINEQSLSFIQEKYRSKHYQLFFSRRNQERDCDTPKQYRPWLPSPSSIRNLAGDEVNALPMPDCWVWDTEDVAQWLKNTIGLPQYKQCFVRNGINGRRLLLVDASVCPIIGINDFKHIQHLTAGIRELFSVELPNAKRSISLPPCYPLTHHLLYHVPTGPKREKTTRVQLFKMMGILSEEEPCPFGHWQMTESTFSSFPANRFGLVKRRNVYQRVELPRQPRGHTYLARSKIRENIFLRVDMR